jgi:uncharacterized protein (DUF169 family)
MNPKEITDMLNLYIRPQTFPVAITMLSSSEKIPDKARFPKRDLGTPVSICQGVGLARRYGWTVAIGKEDQNCPHGLFVLGFIRGESYLDGTSGEAAGAGKRADLAMVAHELSRLEYGTYHYLLAAPLEKATFEPSFIIIYGNPAQIARLVQGAFAMTGKAVTTPTFGGVACSSFVARTLLTDECQVILAGAGDRYFALTQDHELAFTIPWSKAELVVKGLEQGHKSGMHRYPTPSVFRLDGGLPPVYNRWTDLLLQEQ